MSINHVNVHYNQRCYRYKVNNKIIITYIKYQEKNVPLSTTKCTSSEIKNVQQAIYKNIYEQQEEEILNNLVLVSLTRTEYEYRCVFQQLIFYASLGWLGIRIIRHTGILSSTGVLISVPTCEKYFWLHHTTLSLSLELQKEHDERTTKISMVKQACLWPTINHNHINLCLWNAKHEKCPDIMSNQVLCVFYRLHESLKSNRNQIVYSFFFN